MGSETVLFTLMSTEGLITAGAVAEGAGGLAVTLGGLGAVASIGGGIIGATGAMASAQIAQQTAAFNAAALRQDQAQVQQVTALEEARYRRRQSALLASIRAGRAGSGVSIEGTPLLTEKDFRREVEENAEIIRAGGAAEANRLETAARLALFKGDAAQTTGFLQAGTSLLTGFGGAGAALA